MTDQHKFSWKSIALFGAFGAFLLAIVVLIPLLGIRLDAHSERIEKTHSQQRELNSLGLARCKYMPRQAADESMRIKSNEIDIYILPSFSEAMG